MGSFPLGQLRCLLNPPLAFLNEVTILALPRFLDLDALWTPVPTPVEQIFSHLVRQPLTVVLYCFPGKRFPISLQFNVGTEEFRLYVY